MKVHGRLLCAVAALLFSLTSHAQGSQTGATCTNPSAQGALLDEVHTIADSSQGVPAECTLTITNPGTYKVTLTDLGIQPGNPSTPAPLDSVKLQVTQGTTLVGKVLTAPGTTQFDSQGGTYVIRVVGKATQAGSGPIAIAVTDASSNVVGSFSATLAHSDTQKSYVGSIDDSFTVGADGSYVVTLTDMQLPQALQTLTLVVTLSDLTPVTVPFLTAAGSTTVNLTHGTTYRIFAGGLADQAVNAGLFSATVTPAGGGAPAYSKVVPIGTVQSVGSAAVSAGGSYTLKLTDLGVPATLTSVGAVVVASGKAVTQLTAAGTSAPFTSAADTYQVFTAASAATTGSYAVSLTPSGGAAVVSAARAVSAQGTTGPTAYSFDTTVANAGSYTLALADFAFPKSFTSLEAVAIQGGAVLGTPLTVPGTQSVTVAAGPLSVLVFATADTNGSLFGVDLSTGAGSTPVFAATQGVGQLFTARQVSITAAGNYAVNVSDVGFPAPLASFAVMVTNGSSQVGSFFGGGAYNFALTPGNYFINFIAQPGGTDLAGTYALSMQSGPAVQLTSSASTVGSGGTVTLKWASQNATGCTASDGWAGKLDAQGQQTSAALTATTTFTITCTGENTSDKQSVTVTVTAPPPKSGGGGGSIDLGFLVMLLGVTAGRSVIRRSYTRHAH